MLVPLAAGNFIRPRNQWEAQHDGQIGYAKGMAKKFLIGFGLFFLLILAMCSIG